MRFTDERSTISKPNISYGFVVVVVVCLFVCLFWLPIYTVNLHCDLFPSFLIRLSHCFESARRAECVRAQTIPG